jgi:hypothetical protein
MTTPTKIAANRRNARLSTGPRTTIGKLVVAQNAIKHGIFANLPVVPGENPYDWETHRAGIIDSLTPVGLLEVTFAERAALLLWQLARLARYQAAVATTAIEDAGLSPPGVDPFPDALFPPGQWDDEYLKMTEQNLRMARRNHAEVLAAADLLRHLGAPENAPIRGEVAELVLGWAYGAVADYPLRRIEPEHYVDPGFLSRIGVEGVKFKEVAWAPELLLRGLDYYASGVEGTAAEFRADVQAMIDGRVAALARQVSRLEAEHVAIIRRSENAVVRAADAALLPPERTADLVMKYEKHLHGLLNSTLHELERLQARRGGVPVPPPVVADLNVTVHGA